MIRPFQVLIACFCVFILNAQHWEGYFSFQSISALSFEGEKVLAISDNSLILHHLQDKQTETLTTIQGLSGTEITAAYLHAKTKHIVLGHENGLLAPYDPQNQKFYADVSIVNKTNIPNDLKEIRAIQPLNENEVLLACGFGISVYNVTERKFGDSYFFGPGGSQIAVNKALVFEGNIYAATETGLFVANAKSTDLVVSSNWKLLASGHWKTIEVLENQLYASRNNDTQLFVLLGQTLQPFYKTNSPIKTVYASENSLWLTSINAIEEINSSAQRQNKYAPLKDFENATFNCAVGDAENVYIGTQNHGFLVLNKNTNLVAQHSPEGPMSNQLFNIKAIPNELWVVYGDYSIYYNPHPLDSYGVSHLTQEGWINIPYAEVFGAKSLVHVNVDPADPKQVFVGSFHSGLLHIEDNVPKILYDESNSGLRSLTFLGPDYKSIRIRSTHFDDRGDLWTLTAFAKDPLKKRTASGSWVAYDLGSAIPDFEFVAAYANIVQLNDGTLFFGSNNYGITAFKPQGNQGVGKSLYDEKNNFPTNDVRALALDLNEVLWIGTSKGLRVLYNTAGFLNDENPKVQEIIIKDEGAASELLYQQFITDIAVDGNNRKWVTTATAGVFLFSPDGQETIHHFTKENSPLPDNGVNAVSLDPQTGKVYFATPRGLVSFQGNAFAPEENYDQVVVFPNPVRPQFSGVVTLKGLQENSHVKITDIAGHLVFESTSDGGSLQWDTRAFGQHKVASGVYLVFISNQDASETKVTKLMIVR